MRPNELAGALFLITGLPLFRVVDGIARYLSTDYAVPLLVWGPYTYHLVVVMPVALWRHGRAAVVPPAFVLQLVRGALLLGCTFLFFLAVSRMRERRVHHAA